ncbi:hypothetical protein T492DRAFT_126931 [Pavlovales sp. CCMP2436]|nr:hypothetical protein T492DRAFT_126931 [Pavlovales sp. CCMP2436]
MCSQPPSRYFFFFFFYNGSLNYPDLQPEGVGACGRVSTSGGVCFIPFFQCGVPWIAEMYGYVLAAAEQVLYNLIYNSISYIFQYIIHVPHFGVACRSLRRSAKISLMNMSHRQPEPPFTNILDVDARSGRTGDISFLSQTSTTFRTVRRQLEYLSVTYYMACKI